MINEIDEILKKLEIKKTGHYDNHFYIIDLDNSNEYASFYTKLTHNAVNTEYPNFGTNSDNATIKATNYFEFEYENITYDLFLIADFEADKYYLKIKER